MDKIDILEHLEFVAILFVLVQNFRLTMLENDYLTFYKETAVQPPKIPRWISMGRARTHYHHRHICSLGLEAKCHFIEVKYWRLVLSSRVGVVVSFIGAWVLLILHGRV